MEAKESIEAWRKEYNESRPHRALGERTPNEFANEVAASRNLIGLQAAENSPYSRYQKAGPITGEFSLTSPGTKIPGQASGWQQDPSPSRMERRRQGLGHRLNMGARGL